MMILMRINLQIIKIIYLLKNIKIMIIKMNKIKY